MISFDLLSELDSKVTVRVEVVLEEALTMPLSTRIPNGTVGNNVRPQSTMPLKSPDQKGKVKNNKNENEEEEQENTLKDFVIFHLDKFFVEHIPVDSVKELSSTCKLHFNQRFSLLILS